MTARERFRRVMNYEPVDRPLVLAIETLNEGVALARWRQEGLPPNQSPQDFLGMETFAEVPLNVGPFPVFETRLLSETAEHITEIDGWGATVRRRKDAPGMYYGYIEHPVKTRADWENYKWRLQPDTPGRIPADLDRIAAELNASDQPVSVTLYPWFFRLAFYLMGMERFLTAFYEEPDLLHDMFAHQAALTLEVLRPWLGRVKIDFAVLMEDLAYKNGPHVSPRLYEEFWLPYQDPVIAALREAGVPIVSMWSSGNLDAVLPLMRDHGINATWPLERAAGMDPLRVRQEYGRGLLLGGGIPKEALIAGPEAITRELTRLRPLIEAGGYLPALDDVVPPEVPFSTYQFYVEALRKVLG